MATPVVTVASGGLPVTDVTSTLKIGLPITEATSGRGTAVTKVAAGGMPVVYDSGVGSGGGGTAPANTVLPAISGTPQVGSTLTTTDGTWTGSPTPTYTYQWKRGGTNISGATSNTYPLVTADLAATITVTATATNTAGSANATAAAVGPVTTAYTTFDGVHPNITLSNGNLTATHINGVYGVARSTAQKNSGKYYFEVTTTTGLAGANDCVVVITPASVDSTIVGSGTGGGISFRAGGVFANDANSGLNRGDNTAAGTVVGVAVDLDNHKIWFRIAPAGNWNGQVIGSQNPAANTGGASLSNYSATTMAPGVGFDTNVAGAFTANFGQGAFTGAVPSGFTAGWPA